MALTQRWLSLGDFLALPEEEPALELEPNGTIVQKVSPKGQHSTLQLALCDRVNGFAPERHLGRAFPELRTVFGGAVYVPDVSVFRWERIPRATDGKVADDFRVAPDVAIEIVSPDQSTNALVRRCLWYVAHGVRVAMLVDPSDESVVVLRENLAPQVFRGADIIDFAEVLPGFRVTADELFGALYLS